MSNEFSGSQPTHEGQKYTPELIEQAQGDGLLLERLAGLERARAMLQSNPDNPTFQELCKSMEEIVDHRKQELGLIPPDEPKPADNPKKRWHRA